MSKKQYLDYYFDQVNVPSSEENYDLFEKFYQTFRDHPEIHMIELVKRFKIYLFNNKLEKEINGL